ncbi:hypothetical protein CFOL_v3_14327 [Cephalotus follicularis]|uniref:Uncharacterized protein n=1 Tax=Cephalotus follicularis TaxID=3775 RepID=A0A1Q3BSH0_CEPFO|nr:hypothetical protein CFOL_v3_14327 [Cephalotus follicularis]
MHFLKLSEEEKLAINPPVAVTNYTNPMKRPSPENPTSTNSEPKQRKLFQEKAFYNPSNLPGYTKINLHLTTTAPSAPIQSHSSPVLRPCDSDPHTPPKVSVAYPPHSPPENAKMIAGTNAVTPSSSSAAKGSSSSLLPLPAPSRISVSDPVPSMTFSGFSSSNDMEQSPSFQSLKMLKQYLRKASQLADKVLPEDEDVGVGTEETNNATKGDTERQFQEAVIVERDGESLILHFKCPCGKGYHILLCGNSCYYKLL